MNPALTAVIASALIGAGILAAILGFIPAPVPDSAPKRTRQTRTLKRKRSTLIKLAVGAGIGLAAGVVTGWVILIIVVPAAILGVPWLLGSGNSHTDIKRLDALDEWARSLAGVLGAGVSLEQAIISTQGSTAEAIQPQVNALIARLKSRMSTEDALRRFAADLDDTTADKMVCALIMGAQRRNVGLAPILEDLAESVAEDVASRRLIQAERAKQDSVVRYTTLITVVVFAGFLLLGGTYVAPYGTTAGQPVLAVLLGFYVAVLVWFRKLNRTQPLPRLLDQPTGDPS